MSYLKGPSVLAVDAILPRHRILLMHMTRVLRFHSTLDQFVDDSLLFFFETNDSLVNLRLIYIICMQAE